MAINDRDFKVKNGLIVSSNAVISGTLTIAEPTQSNHASTKAFVKKIAFGVIASTAPSEVWPGRIWVDSSESRMKIYNGSSWITMATINDTNTLVDHIHNDAIEGDGRINTIL
jgi:hypothetical protein